MEYNELKEDIHEIKTDVKEIRTMLHKTVTEHQVLKERVDTISGKVSFILTAIGAILSTLAYSIWGWLRSKFGIH